MSSISFFHEDSTCRVPDFGQMHLFHLKNRNGKVILQNNQITEMSRKKRN